MKTVLFLLTMAIGLSSCAQTHGDNSNATSNLSVNANVARNMNTPQSTSANTESTNEAEAQ